MADVIFHFTRQGRESVLEVNDTKTLTFHVSSSGSGFESHISKQKTENLSVAEAKARWPSYARAIDRTIKKMAAMQESSSLMARK